MTGVNHNYREKTDKRIGQHVPDLTSQSRQDSANFLRYEILDTRNLVQHVHFSRAVCTVERDKKDRLSSNRHVCNIGHGFTAQILITRSASNSSPSASLFFEQLIGAKRGPKEELKSRSTASANQIAKRLRHRFASRQIGFTIKSSR